MSSLRIHPSLLVPSREEQGETDVFAGLKSSASRKGGKSRQEKSHLSHHTSSPPLHASLILQLSASYNHLNFPLYRIRTDFFYRFKFGTMKFKALIGVATGKFSTWSLKITSYITPYGKHLQRLTPVARHPFYSTYQAKKKCCTCK